MMYRLLMATLCAGFVFGSAACGAQSLAPKLPGTMSFVFRDVPVTELFEMLSRKERVSIILSRGVTGNVTVNLYDTTLREAIYTIAEAAGYAVEERGGSYLILDSKERQTKGPRAELSMRTVTVQYSNPKMIADILSKQVGPNGRISLLDERKTLVLEDTPENVARMAGVIRELDRPPAQILIEAKILEITLDDTQQFGVDWSHVFGTGNRSAVGTQGLAARNLPGLFFNLVNDNVRVYLNALSSKGKVNTLATPKLLTVENQEAVTNIGDKIGYKVTTTINNVSTESVQFLETGTILRVLPSVDADGRITMKIRPEVSSGSISAGIPSKKTTEVTTQFIAEDGQSILIGGLIKNSGVYRRTGVPVISNIPGIGGLFSATENAGVSTETIVIITPKIMRGFGSELAQDSVEKVNKVQQVFDKSINPSEQELAAIQPRLTMSRSLSSP